MAPAQAVACFLVSNNQAKDGGLGAKEMTHSKTDRGEISPKAVVKYVRRRLRGVNKIEVLGR